MNVHKTARHKLIQLFQRNLSITSGVILLEGGKETCQYDTDTDVLFKQDSWFSYLFGVKEGGFYGVIDIESGRTTLFMPRLPEEYRIWCGAIHPPEYFQHQYVVDEVLFADSLDEWLHSRLSTLQRTSSQAKVFLMKGVNSDSGASAQPASFASFNSFLEKGWIDLDQLHPLLSHCRVTKSPEEITVMRYAANVASMAHVSVMREFSTFSFEYEMEAKFLYEIYRQGGCRRSAYISICACGPNAAVLHYGHAGAPNDRKLRPSDIALLDMGAEYHGYCSDITCSVGLSHRECHCLPDKPISYGYMHISV